MIEKTYNVGIYCRLSNDDERDGESVSIENQYEILSRFVMLNGWIEVKTYRDDGYSGGNFQRPGFLEMLEDARHGLINLILVKDLSRLGRDFVEVGRYTDVIFPSLGCRFVSVLDCLDSEGDNTDMLHFRSLMNDYHLKDLSGKIKSVLYAKKKSGQYLTAYAPYGYRKSDEDKHRLVVDDEAAAVVQEVYRMRCSGMAYGKIAAALNSQGILSPRWYWELHYGKKGGCKYSKLWTYATVKNILNDTVYPYTASDIQPAFVQAKGFNLVSIVLIDFSGHLAEADVFPHIWRQYYQMGTMLPGLPDSHTGFDAIGLGNIDSWLSARCRDAHPGCRILPAVCSAAPGGAASLPRHRNSSDQCARYNDPCGTPPVTRIERMFFYYKRYFSPHGSFDWIYSFAPWQGLLNCSIRLWSVKYVAYQRSTLGSPLLPKRSWIADWYP